MTETDADPEYWFLSKQPYTIGNGVAALVDGSVYMMQADGKPTTIGNVLEKIAEKLQAQNGDIKNVLEADKVFEHGFNLLAGGFDVACLPTKSSVSGFRYCRPIRSSRPNINRPVCSSLNVAEQGAGA